MFHPTARILFPVFILAASAFAHYTWIAPLSPLEAGKTVVIQIGHGHKFPVSEEAINASQVELFVLAPSGARTQLKPASAGTAVTAPFTVKESGVHRVALIQDRGITSRTPAGVRPGGRDKNANAIQASRTLRTAVAYTGVVSNIQPSGLEFELAGAYSGGAWNLRLLKSGKPVSGAAVEAFLSGASKAVPAGQTDAEGRVSFRPPAGSKGPAVFSVGSREPAPTGAHFDSTNYETSLHVSW
jgi:uncharacterized GH25 family protein